MKKKKKKEKNRERDIKPRRKKKSSIWGTFLVVQWLRLYVSNAGGPGLTSGQGTKIPHAEKHNQTNFFKLLNISTV